ncbi:MAG: M48 family metalloprotease [Dermatophilaceae bacterium]
MNGLALAALAVLLAAGAPRVMAPRTRFRHAPRAALVAWQSVTVAGVAAALAAAPASGIALASTPNPRGAIAELAVTAPVSLVVLGRLLVSGHRVGTRLRAVRARHRELVDVVARRSDDRLRVLRHPTLTAYCIPGRRGRVVVSDGILETLDDAEVEAVVAHEGAHLRARHDLLLEFFSVVHEAVPPVVRSEAALAEVRLLVEALADRVAARHVGEIATARALVALAEARNLDDGPGRAGSAGGAGSAAGAGGVSGIEAAGQRLRLLAAAANPWLSVLGYAYAAVVLTLPVVLFATAWR